MSIVHFPVFPGRIPSGCHLSVLFNSFNACLNLPPSLGQTRIFFIMHTILGMAYCSPFDDDDFDDEIHSFEFDGFESLESGESDSPSE